MLSRPATARLILLAIVLFAAALRWSSLHDEMWIDELHTTWTIAGNLEDIAPRATTGNLSPLVYYPFWAFVQVIGLSDFTVRLPFFLCGLGTVALVYHVVQRETDSLLAAATASLLVALHDNCIFFAVEGRIYAAVQLVGLLHLWSFLQLLKPAAGVASNAKSDSQDNALKWHAPRRRLLWVLLGALLLHLHYTAGLLLVAEWTAYAVVRSLRRDDPPAYSWWNLIFDSGLMVLALLPVFLHIVAIAGRRQNWARALTTTINPLAILFITSILPVLGAAVLAQAILRRGRRAPEAEQESLALWIPALLILWMVVPPVIAWTLGALDIVRIFLVRYVVVSLVAPMVMVGIVVRESLHPWHRWVVACVAVASVLATNYGWREVILYGEPAIDRQESWGTAVRELNAELSSTNSTKPVFVYTGYIESAGVVDDGMDPLLREFCYSTVRTHYWLDVPDERLHPMIYAPTGKLTPGQAKLLRQEGGWFLIRGDRVGPVKRRIELALRQSGFVGEFQWRVKDFDQLHWMELSLSRNSK